MVERAAITEFSLDPTPECIGEELLYSLPPKVHHGREAVVAEVMVPDGKRFALKWYDSLQGQSAASLEAYAQAVNSDEQGLIDCGLTEAQIPRSHFFLASQPDGEPRLYALQPWAQGMRLKDISTKEVLTNSELCQSLANLIIKSHDFYLQTGRVPDLSGGDRFKVFGKYIPDPRKNLWPLRSANIIISGNTAVLPDAKTCVITPGTFKYDVVMFHHTISVQFAHWLAKNKPKSP